MSRRNIYEQLLILALLGEKFIAEYIALRSDYKTEGSYEKADEIRSMLFKLDIVLEDTPRGTVWRWL